MIVPQQAFLQGEPQMQHIPLRNVPKIENTILIQNLDQFVTETMLYQKFKEIGELAFFKLKVERTTGESKGQAIVEFRDQKCVEEAINRFNGTTFFDVAVDQNQRKMYVMKKLDKDTMTELKQNGQLFFKYQYHGGEDQKRLDERRFRDFMSKFGEIQSCKFRQHKGTPLLYGQLIFRQVQDKKNFLDNPENRNLVIDQFTFSFSEYNIKKEQIFSIFLKDFKGQNPLQPSYSQEDKNFMLEQVRGFIWSQIENEQVKKNCEVFINFDEKHLLPTAFINVKSEEIAEYLQEKFLDSVLYVKIIYPKGTDKNLNKTVLMHNLKVPKRKILPPFAPKDGGLVQQLSQEVELFQELSQEGGLAQSLDTSGQAQFEQLKENSEEYETELNKERAEEIRKALCEIEEERVEEVTQENGKTEKKRVKYHPYKNVSVYVFCVLDQPTVVVDNSTASSNTSSSNNLGQTQQVQNVPKDKNSVPLTQVVWVEKIRQGHIVFAKKADLQKFLTQYHSKNYRDKLKHFFLNNSYKFNINISKTQRLQLREAQKRGKQKHLIQQEIESVKLQQAQISFNQFNQMQNYQTMSNQPQIQNNFINPNRQFQQNRPPYGGYNNSNQYQQNNSYNSNTSPNRQQQNNQPPRPYTNYNNSNSRFINNSTGQYQNNQNRNQNQNTQLRNNFPAQQTQPQTQKIQPSIINPQPQPQNSGNRNNAITHPQQQQQVSQQFNTLQEIKNKREAFVQLKEEEQKLILGKLIYPKVQSHLNNTNQNQTEVTQITPKITGMLIDFSVFEIDDIIDMLENEEEFKERIEEAIGLIKNQNQN